MSIIYEEPDNYNSPKIVVHYHGKFGSKFYDIKDWDHRDQYGITWRLTQEDPFDLTMLAHYYPVRGVQLGTNVIQLKPGVLLGDLKEWTYELPNFDPDNFITTGLYVPCISLSYVDGWCWTTKRPFARSGGYSMSAIKVMPNIFKINHEPTHEIFGDNYIEFCGQKYMLGTPSDLLRAYGALETEMSVAVLQ